MTQEDKELLLKDLCARLPYGVKCKYYDWCEDDYDEGTILGFERKEYIVINGKCSNVEEVKPYLFPLSSMTEEQGNEYHELIRGMFGTSALINFEALEEFFHKNHIDYRGLIPMGLAIDATGLNIY